MSLPASDSANGLSDYYITPEIGAQRAKVGWNTIEEALLPPDLSVANVDRMLSEHQYLASQARGQLGVINY